MQIVDEHQSRTDPELRLSWWIGIIGTITHHVSEILSSALIAVRTYTIEAHVIL
jgi:hypothetical protein